MIFRKILKIMKNHLECLVKNYQTKQNIDYKDMAYQYKDAMHDHRNTIINVMKK